jgi:exosortase E/protease (VPEID-CTERM system)
VADRNKLQSKLSGDVRSRFLALCCVLAVEYVAATSAVPLWFQIHRILVSAILVCGSLCFFGRKRLGELHLELAPIHRGWVAVHWVALLIAALATTSLASTLSKMAMPATASGLLWVGAVAMLPVSLVAALFPLRRLLSGLASLGWVWAYAGVTAIATTFGAKVLHLLWDLPGSRLGHVLQVVTFDGTRILLSAFYRGVVSHPESYILGTQKFQVEIASLCSGMEGLALMLVFTSGWLIFARRELRMSRAIWLAPLALIAGWLLNMVRIAALIAIGDAGHQEIAVHGFHSEAGWILFNAVGIGFVLVANNLQWFRREPVLAGAAIGSGWSPDVPVAVTETNQPAVYLLPFLAILTASLFSQALSGGFEWLYPLRLVAACAALYLFRREYRRMDWSFGWLGPAAGVAVFLLWLGLSLRLPASPATATLANGLAALVPWQRYAWIAARTVAAVVTVPIAEELAFRGYLARRIMASDVELIPFSRVSVVAIAISSAAFGAMHGSLWFAGIIAGLDLCFGRPHAQPAWRSRRGACGCQPLHRRVGAGPARLFHVVRRHSLTRGRRAGTRRRLCSRQ